MDTTNNLTFSYIYQNTAYLKGYIYSMDDNKVDSVITACAFLIAFGLSTAAVMYWWWFSVINDRSLSTSPSTWGAFGDFVGGILNPLVALSALFMLITSVRIQKKELAETRKALTDTSQSQAEQARLAAQQSEIEIKKMAYDKTNIFLQAELTYQQSLVNLANSQYSGKVTNRKGDQVTLREELDSVVRRIIRLRELQDHTILITDNMLRNSDPK